MDTRYLALSSSSRMVCRTPMATLPDRMPPPDRQKATTSSVGFRPLSSSSLIAGTLKAWAHRVCRTCSVTAPAPLSLPTLPRVPTAPLLAAGTTTRGLGGSCSSGWGSTSVCGPSGSVGASPPRFLRRHKPQRLTARRATATKRPTRATTAAGTRQLHLIVDAAAAVLRKRACVADIAVPGSPRTASARNRFSRRSAMMTTTAAPLRQGLGSFTPEQPCRDGRGQQQREAVSRDQHEVPPQGPVDPRGQGPVQGASADLDVDAHDRRRVGKVEDYAQGQCDDSHCQEGARPLARDLRRRRPWRRQWRTSVRGILDRRALLLPG